LYFRNQIDEKLKSAIYILLIFLVLLQLSCNKTLPDAPLLPPGRSSNLIAYTWGLISALSIDSLSTGILHNYAGKSSDSVHFLWTLGGAVSVYAVCSFIQENGDSSIANIVSRGFASGVPFYDSSEIAYDTIITSTPWRTNYSDTLFISKVSQTRLVFQVGYSDSTGTGVEVDSFRNVGPYRPY
jgi:hypothetical protein